ncbi:MAG: multidrug resistance efflux transporter family protein [Desulfosarcina sp.]|nr:multidrug resistance efflux transporter family protein [Desulfosarcina sp.]MBC2741849.1 multidrug resistance efflux transporter family protein [Desulfosarcina sp.]MBC2764762.1 multidrug resistance efflux transporter family protein [Desulfosarcina sp.]
MVRLILIGLLAGFFFSSTFVLNRIMSLGGGHWVWSASLRYAYMILLLTAWLLVFQGTAAFARTLGVFFNNLVFWVAAGSIGFGAFYALICFSADYAPGWIVATTWQFTIIATLVVLMAFGRRFPKRIWVFSAIVFAGVFLVNISQAGAVYSTELIKGALPVLIAAFCYPIGNQLVWEAKTGHGWLPDISGPELEHPFAKVLLMSLGSVPFWCLLVAVTTPPPPASGQIANTALVALFSGVMATSLFLFARNESKTGSQLAAVDATQSSEVIFALTGEILIIGTALPNALGVLGILVTGAGLMLFVRFQETPA